MPIDFRGPVFTMGKDRYSDIYDLAVNKGFSLSDADQIAFNLPRYWDGMSGLNAALTDFILRQGDIYLSEEGQARAKVLIERKGAADDL